VVEFWYRNVYILTCMHVFMTKVISISDEAYERLVRIKRNLSFSKIIIEITKDNSVNNIMSFAGLLSNEEADKIKNEIKRIRQSPSRRFK